VTLKLATEDDIPAVVMMLVAFHEQSPYKDIKLNMSRVFDLVTRVVVSDQTKNTIILKVIDDLPVGMVVGQVAEFPLTGGLIASELAWWVSPDHRKGTVATELLEAYEYWAKLLGCKFIQAVALTNEYEKVLSRFYNKRGYRSYETCFMKEL
jgi:GNAT superfamily N-acetyltransferase